jgi:carbamoyltransferase
LTIVLGLSAFHPGSAAVLVDDGELVAAAHEESFSRIAGDATFPARAAAYCLREARRQPEDVGFIAFCEKPRVRLRRLLETCLALAPRGLKGLAAALPSWLQEKLFLRRRIRRDVGGSRGPILFLDRPEGLAAGAFFASPYDEAAILTLDGHSGWTSATCGTGRGNRLELTADLGFPHDIGVLCSAFSYYCGAGDLTALAPFGRPVYRDLITSRLIDVRDDGSFHLDFRYFVHERGQTWPTRRFERLFGTPPRHPEAPVLQRHMDLAASVQAVVEDTLLRLARDLHCRTGMRHLALGGSMTRNPPANGRLARDGPFESVWIQPDASGALGGALFVWHQLLDKPREPAGEDGQKASLLGPAFDTPQVLRAVGAAQCPHRRFTDDDELSAEVAEALAGGDVVGWFSGRMGFGPAALGSRSILADPRSPELQADLCRLLAPGDGPKPLAAAVLAEHAAEWFDLRPGQESPYGLVAAPVAECYHRPLSDEQAVTMAGDPDLARRMRISRTSIPAVTHVDYSARVQTVDARRNPRFHRLLRSFYRLTGCPLLAHGDLHAPGGPLVCTPAEALRCVLAATEVDLLVLEDVLVSRDGGGRRVAGQRQEHLAGLGFE